MKKPKVYCAGSMSAHPKDFNFPAFFSAAKFMESQGYTAINPAQLDIDAGYTLEKLKQLSPTEFQEFLKGAMKRDLEAIQSCDALVLLPGWEGSKGARAEKAVAEWGGKRVGYLWSGGGDGFRLTWEYERKVPCFSVHEPAAPVLIKPKPQPDVDGWIPHVPGDPMPCDGDLEVHIKFRDGVTDDFGAHGSNWNWDKCFHKKSEIIAWRPHQPEQPLPYNSDERAEWDLPAEAAMLPDYTKKSPLHSPGDATYVDRDSRGNITGSGYAANDPKGAAGALKAPMWLLPPSAMSETAWVHKHGADKYGPFNWREGSVCASTYISAIMRHLDLWRDGEDSDTESGRSHLASIAASCNILMDAAKCGTLFDDRRKLK